MFDQPFQRVFSAVFKGEEVVAPPPPADEYLLLETSDKLLLETSDKLLLE
jgi:hypothetical protein